MPLRPDEELLKKVPARSAARWRALPLLKKEDGSIQVAMADPDDLEAVADLRLLFGAPVVAVARAAQEIDEAIHLAYGLGASAIEEPDEASMVRFVNDLLLRAHKDRATDIHIEPYDDELAVRFRIDGILHPLPIPRDLARFKLPLISRVKVMAQMNIAEKRLPQDGRIRFAVEGDELDIRVSTLPTINGESLDLRLLPKTRTLLGMEELGMPPEIFSAINRLITRPNGIILVTGPTGHGKTTTLYSALSRINTPEKKIIAIEDPVEIRLKGVNQIQVHSKIGLSFATGLRSILRQDPDVIMVGEIRDLDTAEISIRSSLTGHLVFSTLHTTDAVGAITRLIDMGIDPYLVASSLSAVLAQRLVRIRCKACGPAGRDFPSPDRAQPSGKSLPAEPPPLPGCEHCRFTGYRGRTGIFELLIITEELRRLILERAPQAAIRKVASAAGMRTLHEDGQRKVAAGLTTKEEVLRVTEEDAGTMTTMGEFK